jgi:Ser/Thr protein kinase RdoA (MazF antagonist)
MKPYPDLTSRGQARRLRQLALHALQAYDLDIARLRLLTNSFNCIFRLDTASGDKFVLRVTLPEGGHTLAYTRAEMAWLDALARDTDLSVPAPLPARDGALVVQASAPGVPEPRLCAIFRWVPGIDLSERLTLENMAQLGLLMARLHAHAAVFRLPQEYEIPRFDQVFYFPEPVVLFDEPYRDLFPPARRRLYQHGLDFAQAAFARLQASGEPARLIHNDLHAWNVRLHRGILSPIDFEDLVWGWPVQDIGTAMYYFYANESYPALRQAFQDGYTRLLPWPERAPGEVDAFILARGLMLVNFTLTDPNPDWRAAAPRLADKLEHILRQILSE